MRGWKKVWRGAVWVTAYLYIPVMMTLAFVGNSDGYADLPFEADEGGIVGRRVNVIYNNAQQEVSLDDFVAMVVAGVYRSTAGSGKSGTYSDVSVSGSSESSGNTVSSGSSGNTAGAGNTVSSGGSANTAGMGNTGSTDEDETIRALGVVVRSDVVAQMGKRECVDSDRLENGFVTKSMMKNWWGDEWKSVFEKIRQLVSETTGEVLTYEGECVRGLYTRVSPGVTVSGEKLFGKEYAYLSAVECSEDAGSAEFERVMEYSDSQILNIVKKWEKENDIDSGVDRQNPSGDIQITAKTDEGYVTGVQMGDVCMSGERFAAIFDLKSPYITLEYRSGAITMTSRGVGQGAGMSLYSANCMAARGSGYTDILKTFYPKCSIEELKYS